MTNAANSGVITMTVIGNPEVYMTGTGTTGNTVANTNSACCWWGGMPAWAGWENRNPVVMFSTNAICWEIGRNKGYGNANAGSNMDQAEWNYSSYKADLVDVLHPTGTCLGGGSAAASRNCVDTSPGGCYFTTNRAANDEQNLAIAPSYPGFVFPDRELSRGHAYALKKYSEINGINPPLRPAHFINIDMRSTRKLVNVQIMPEGGADETVLRRFPKDVEIFYSDSPIGVNPYVDGVTSAGTYQLILKRTLDGDGNMSLVESRDQFYSMEVAKDGVVPQARYFQIRMYSSSRGEILGEDDTLVENHIRRMRIGINN